MKKKFSGKKMLALLLAVLMVGTLSMLSGCKKIEVDYSLPESNESSEASTPETTADALSFYVYATDETKDFWNNAVKAFSEANGVSVDLVAEEEIGARLRSDILAGKVPDAVFLPSWDGSGVTEALIADKALMELSGIESLSNDKNSYCQPYGNGKTYVAPYGISCCGLWYNAAAVTGTLPTSLAELASFNAGEDTAVLAYAGKDAISLLGLAVPAITAEDASFADRLFGGDVTVWEGDIIANMAKDFAALSADNILDDDSYEYDQGDVVMALATGKVAFGLLSDVNAAKASAAQKARTDDDVTPEAIEALELTYLPLGGSCYAQMGDLYIMAEAKHAEDAKKLVSYLLTADRSGIDNVVSGSSLYSYRVAEAVNDVDVSLDRQLVNHLATVLYGNCSAQNFVSQMQEIAKSIYEGTEAAE